MFWFTTTTTGRNRSHPNGQRSHVCSPDSPCHAGKTASTNERYCPTPPPPCEHLHSSSAVISSEPSATGRFTFPRLPADSQLCFELKRAHTNTRPSAISVAICLLIFPGRADTVQQTDKQHKRSGAEHSSSKRCCLPKNTTEISSEGEFLFPDTDASHSSTDPFDLPLRIQQRVKQRTARGIAKIKETPRLSVKARSGA